MAARRKPAVSTPAPKTPTPRKSAVAAANQRVRSTALPSITGAASLTVVGQGQARRSQAAPASRNNAVRQKQQQAWAYFDSLGLVKYAAYFYGKSLSRIRLVPGIVGPDGRPRDALDEENKPIEEAPLALEVSEILAELRAPIGGQSSILRSFGVNLFVAGECSLTGMEEKTGETWEVLSVDELHSKGRDSKGNELYERFDGPGAQGSDLPAGSFVCRVFQPHERFKSQADSSLMGVLDVCEELVLLQREIRAEALSRIPNGILAVADEISYGPPTLAGHEDEPSLEGDVPPDDLDEDPFTADLLEVMMTAIRDKSSAAAMMPIVVRGPAEAIEKGLKHLLLQRPESARTLLKRKEAVEMFAIGIDLPVEVILGHSNTTFANAFQIDEDTYKVHILPLMQLVADGITHGYLWPKMAKARKLDPGAPLPDEITQNVVFWDPTNLLTNPDRSQQATEGHKMYTLSDAAWRRACGFNETDAPDADEVERRLSIDERLAGRQPDQPGQFPQDGRPPRNVNEALAAAAAPAPDPLALLAARISGAADVSIERAVERCGSRLRNAARKNGHAALVDGVPSGDVALTLGPTVCAALLGDEPTFPGEFAALCRKAQEYAREAGVPDPGEFAMTVGSVAEQVAERRLYGDTGLKGDQFLQLVTTARNGG